LIDPTIPPVAEQERIAIAIH